MRSAIARHAIRLLIVNILVTTLVQGVAMPRAQAGGVPSTFNPNLLIEDDSFIATNSMSVGEIQRFLELKGGALRNFTENGRSAAQIIWDAAHGHDQASGTWNGIVINQNTGTVNPRVILVTLQKEQSLITSTSPSQTALTKAMGYGCPDNNLPSDKDANQNGCYDQYEGFTRQVENGAWQLRYNYERTRDAKCAAGFQKGVTTYISERYREPATFAFTPSNQATAALYCYTPYVYNGNYNFWNLFRQWFVRWSAEVVGRNGNQTVARGGSVEMVLLVRNTGEETWQKGVFNLGTERERDRIPVFIREDRQGNQPSGWIRDNRVALIESQVRPGEIGTFRFYYTVPDIMPTGTYREYFRPVYENLTWLPQPNFDLSWDLTVTESIASLTKTEWVTQNSNPTLAPGQSYQFEVQFRNTGREAWHRDTVKLGTDRDRDRTSVFIREDVPGGNPSGWLADNRVQMVEQTVAPGAVGTFRFWYTVPANLPAGTYREYFRQVIEYVTWMEDLGVHWDIVVAS